MICPYNNRSETQFQSWKQSPDETGTLRNGVTTTQTIYEPMKCAEEQCGAWQDGKCCYNGSQ